MAIEVTLIDHTPDPVRTLYTAFRVCYSALTPAQIEARIADGRISREQMQDFIDTRLATGHASPLQQIWFEFGISGVSRAFSHQFVRHHIGISFEQQSQRYVTYKDGTFPFTTPESVRRAGKGRPSSAPSRPPATPTSSWSTPGCRPRTPASCCRTRRTRTSRSS